MIAHCTSTYPSRERELNLRVIPLAARALPDVPIGYSGHELGLVRRRWRRSPSGACVVERHITLDRSMFGSDQSASIEPQGLSA